MRPIKNTYEKYSHKVIENLGYLINPFLLNFKSEKNKLLIFYFHGLYESLKQKQLNHIDPQNNMTVSQFIDFIEYFLHHKYKFIVPEDLLTGLKEDQSYAMITFDDGYFNNILVLEILRKYNIPAVFFITTNNVIGNKSYWWDIIYKFRVKQGINLETIRNEQRSLKSLKFPSINKYITQNFGIKAFEPWSDIDRPFNENEIKNLARNPYASIGNHTHNHTILTYYTRDEIKQEFSESNNILFNLTGKYPISAAFPNGNYNDMVLKATEEAGFKYAFTTEPKKNPLPIENAKLRRLDRYHPNTTEIIKYGSFFRMGYEPEDLSDDLKIKIKSLLRKR
jgi:peptidoglycan/xylan/chitin deacetylase (PgdA/CDA1 family)